jgi:hypothetical protein
VSYCSGRGPCCRHQRCCASMLLLLLLLPPADPQQSGLSDNSDHRPSNQGQQATRKEHDVVRQLDRGRCSSFQNFCDGKVKTAHDRTAAHSSAQQRTRPHTPHTHRTQTAHRAKTVDSSIGSDRHPLIFLTSKSRYSARVSCWASLKRRITGSSW